MSVRVSSPVQSGHAVRTGARLSLGRPTHAKLGQLRTRFEGIAGALLGALHVGKMAARPGSKGGIGVRGNG